MYVFAGSALLVFCGALAITDAERGQADPRPRRDPRRRRHRTLEWVDWFNNRRLFEPIGHIPPAEFEEMFYREQSLIEDEGLTLLSLH